MRTAQQGSLPQEGITVNRIAMLIGFAWLGLALVASLGAAAESEEGLPPIELGAPAQIEVHPTAFQLDSVRRRLRPVVTAHYEDGRQQDVTRLAHFSSSNAAVLQVSQGVVGPLADGFAEVLVEVGRHSVALPVIVTQQDRSDPVSFEYGALVALSKQDCNSGACHGSPSGKGGFRLSLRAYDPELDALTLVREGFNRRTNVAEPELSLLLRKPLMEIAHGGGRRMNRDDASFVLLRDWIAEGLSTQRGQEPSCVRVEVYPSQRVLRYPARLQQLSVLARFSDGSVRDITDVAIYASSDEGVAVVHSNGLVVGQTRGEAAILVRYLEHVETSHLTFLQEVDHFEWNPPAEQNYVDRLVFEKLQQMQIHPSPVCSDEEFVRRIYFDVLGVLPAVSEVEAFLSDSAADKRARLIDRLFERDEYAEFWALKWGDLLRLNNKRVSAAGVHKLHRWLVASVRDNMPYDQFASQLLTAQGSTFDNPPANYFRTAADTNDCTETTAQLFLGIRIQCAKCHNHPFERWTQDNYYGIGAFFNRVQRKPTNLADELIVFVSRAGEVTQPRTGQQMKPWLPLTGDLELVGEEDRRHHLAAWLCEPGNPFFAQAEVNRIWGHLMGRGIVEPVDDFRASNPPSNEALLAALAQEFVESGFDRNQILRTILNSSTYQLSSRKSEWNRDDTKYFSHARTRLLSAEQLLDAICQVTGLPEKYAGLPDGTRATQLPTPDVDNGFLKVFGQPAREMACQCERSNESNLSQALQMINGPLVHGKLAGEGNRIRTLVEAGKSDEQIVGELYLAALCRPPSEAEMAAAMNHIGTQTERLAALEDVCWALLNAKSSCSALSWF